MKKSLLLLFAICLVGFGSVYGQHTCSFVVSSGPPFFPSGNFTFTTTSQSGVPCNATVTIEGDASTNSPIAPGNFTFNNVNTSNSTLGSVKTQGTTTWTIVGNTGVSCDQITIGFGSNVGGTCANSTSPDLTAMVAPLPVELTSFEAKKEASVTVLNWQTATEENNEKFEIEVSQDGKNFTKIGEVAGHGTTQEVQNYEFIDAQPKAGVNYYRLKQLDYNGVFDYSNIVSVDFTATTLEPVSVFPNPVKSQLNIINGEGQATVYNILGQPVKELTIDNEQLTMDVSDLASGQYVLRIIQNGGTVVTKQFTK